MNLKNLLLVFLCCNCFSTQGQVVFGALYGYGLPIYDKGTKAPGDPKSAAADITPIVGGSLMVYAGPNIGLGVAVYGQTYSFTMHSGQANNVGYTGTDLVHHSDYIFFAPTLSFILDPRDYLQINISPLLAYNNGGYEYVKNYAVTSGGVSIAHDSTSTTENIQQLIFGASLQFQQNIALSRHFRLCFIENYTFMASQVTQTDAVNKFINPGYISLQAAFTYRIHKRSVKFFSPSFK